MGRVIVLVKRSHLRSCTLDCGTAVGNPNCAQSVADDNSRVPKSICWLLGCIRSTSPEPKGVVQHVATWWCFAAWCKARFQRRLWSKTRLAGRARRLIVIDRSWVCPHACCLLTTQMSAPPHSKVASSICGGFLPTTCWNALYPLSLIFDAMACVTASQSSSKSVHVCASGPSCVFLKWFLFQSLPARSVLPVLHGAVSLQVVFRRFQLFLQNCQCTKCAVDQRQRCGAFRMIAANCFFMLSSRSLPTDPAGK